MATGRILRKSISYSEKMGKLKSSDACLLYTWLLAHLDVNGNFYSNPNLIKGLVVTTRKEFTIENIQEFLIEFESLGLIKAYKPDDDTFIHYPDFVSKQIRLEKEKPKFPLFSKEKQVSLIKPVGITSELRRKPVSNVIELNRTELNLCDKTEKSLTATEQPSLTGSSFVKLYAKIYLELNKTEYPANWGADGKALKELLAVYGAEKLETYIRYFLSPSYEMWNGKKNALSFKTEVEKIARFISKPEEKKYNPGAPIFVKRGETYLILNNGSDDWKYTADVWERWKAKAMEKYGERLEVRIE